MRLKDIDKIQITPYFYTDEELAGIRKLLGIMDDLPTVETDTVHAMISAVPYGVYTTPLTAIKSHLVQGKGYTVKEIKSAEDVKNDRK